MLSDAHLKDMAERGFLGSQVHKLRAQVKRALDVGRSELRCMQHPLGFYHLLLYQDGPLNLRLHYWPRKQCPPSSAITPYHDHVWILESCILEGTIENVVLSLTPDKAGEYALASIQQIAGVDQVVPSPERVSIASTETTSYSVGESYSISPGVFHCTQVPTEVSAITLVKAKVVTTGGPRTLVPPGYRGQAPARVYLNDGDRLALLDQIQLLLS